jgi:hypothetical protein
MHPSVRVQSLIIPQCVILKRRVYGSAWASTQTTKTTYEFIMDTLPMPPPTPAAANDPASHFRALTTLLYTLRTTPSLAPHPPGATTSSAAPYTRRLDSLASLLGSSRPVAVCVRYQRYPQLPDPAVWIFSSSIGENKDSLSIQSVPPALSQQQQPLTSYLLQVPAPTFREHCAWLLGWLVHPPPQALQVLEAYVVFRHVGPVLRTLRGGPFLATLEEAGRSAQWVRRFERPAGWAGDLKVGERLWARMGVLQGERRLWPKLAEKVERRLRWEAELGLTCQEVQLQMWVPSGWVIGWGAQIRGVPIEEEEEEEPPPPLPPPSTGEFPTDPLYTAATARDFNVFLLHHLHLLENTLAALLHPPLNPEHHILLRKQLHLLLRLFHSLATDRSHLLLRHLQYVSFLTTTATTGHLHTWPLAAKVWVESLYAPVEAAHKFHSITQWHTLQRLIPSGDVGLVCASSSRTMQPWEEVITGLLGAPGAGIIIHHLRSLQLPQLQHWSFQGCVCPVAALVGLHSERNLREPWARLEFRHLDSLVGTSRPVCAVCELLLQESGFVVTRKSSVVRPVALPRVMAAPLREKVTRAVEEWLRQALMEVLWGFEPAFKELPEDYGWEWEEDDDEEEDTEEEEEEEGEGEEWGERLWDDDEFCD